MPSLKISYTGSSTTQTATGISRLYYTESGILRLVAWVGGPAGPQGPSGYNGLDGTGIVDFSGYITTGSADDRYYPLHSNPSGYLTGIDLNLLTGFFYPLNANPSGYVTQTELEIKTGEVVNYIETIIANSGYLTTGNAAQIYYPNTNPSGFITGINTGYLTGYLLKSETGQFASVVSLNNTGNYLLNYFNSGSGYLQSQIDNLDSQYYPLSGNPSGYINNAGLTGLSGQLYGLIEQINNSTGNFYLNSNPSGFITNFNLTGASGSLQNSIGLVSGQLSNYYPLNNPSGYLNTLSGLSIQLVTGISGNLSDRLYNTGANIISYIQLHSGRVVSLNSLSGILSVQGTGSNSTILIGSTIYISGSAIPVNVSGYITTGDADSRYYPRQSNPSGYLQSLSGLSVGYVSGASGILQGQINNIAGNTGLYYLNSNPSGFITSGQTGQFASTALVTNLSGQLTNDLATKAQLTVTGQTLLGQIGQLTGVTGLFYLNSNPSGFITSVGLSGASGSLQVQINNVNNITGSFYLNSNPSGYITNFNLTGASGALQSTLNLINNTTGIFITTGQTGQFVSQTVFNNFSGYIVSLIDAASAGVSSINGASGTMTIAGAGNVFVTTAGQTITISGSGTQTNLSGYLTTGQADLRYYPLATNPSGYLVSLSGLSVSYVSGASGALQNQINSTSGQLTNYYLNSNPNGFLNSLSGLSVGYISGASGVLQGQITSLNNVTGEYYPRQSNPSGYLQTLSGLSITYVSGASGALRNQIIDTGNSLINYVQLNSGRVVSLNNLSGILSITGTGSNSIVVIGSTIYVSGSAVPVNVSGYITTGDADSRYYPRQSNPSGYLQSLSGLSISYVSGASGMLQSQITNLNSVTGTRYYPRDFNPSGYLQSLSGLSISYVSGASGVLQNQITTLNNATGGYYPRTNPSGFITNFNLTGASGALQAQIASSSAGVSTLNGLSGAVNLRGTGSVFLSIAGQIIHISGSGQSFPENSLAYQNSDNVALSGGTIGGIVITGGSIDATPIGNITPESGRFSTLNTEDNTSLASIGGDVSVGTPDKVGKFHVRGNPLGEFLNDETILTNFSNTNDNENIVRLLQFRHTSGQGWANASTRLQQITDVTTQSYIEFNPIGDPGLAFGHNGFEQARLKSNGYLGIGVTDPQVVLHVRSDSGDANNFVAIRLTEGFGGQESWDLRVWNNYPEGSPQLGVFSIYNVDNQRSEFIIDQIGNVGVGMPWPTARLHTSGTLRFEGFTETGFLQIDTFGNVSINTGTMGGSGPSAPVTTSQFRTERLLLPTGLDSYYIEFSGGFTGIPTVVGSLEYTGFSPVIATVSGINTGGFGLTFSDNLGINPYYYNYIAISGNILNIFAISGGGGGVGDVTYAQLTGVSGVLQAQISNISGGGNTGSSGPLPVNIKLAQYGITIDAGTSDIQTGYKGYFQSNSSVTLSGWNIVSTQTGTILIDVIKTNYNSFPNSYSIITGIALALNNQNKTFSNILTGWNTDIVRGDILEFVIKGCTGIKKINVSLTGVKQE